MNKVRSLLGFGVGLMILGAGSLPVFAGSQRYPTNAEVQRLIREFRQRSSSPPVPTPGECCGGWEADRRTPAQKQPLETFVRTWSRVEPALAPFLGHWVNNDADIYVYPSNVRGRVCVIFSTFAPSYSFSLVGHQV